MNNRRAVYAAELEKLGFHAADPSNYDDDAVIYVLADEDTDALTEDEDGFGINAKLEAFAERHGLWWDFADFGVLAFRHW